MDERDAIREALMPSQESPGELEQRFKSEIGAMLQRRLSRTERVASAIMAVLVLAVAPVIVYVAYAPITDRGEAQFIRLFAAATLAVGLVMWLWTAVLIGTSAVSGKTHSRPMQKANVFIPFAAVLIYNIFFLMRIGDIGLEIEGKIAFIVVLLLFLGMTGGAVLLAHMGWNRQDLLIEQKKMQLEIALLREELRRGRSGAA